MKPRSAEREAKTDVAPHIYLQPAEDESKTNISHYSLLQSTDENNKFYSENEIKGAEKVLFQRKDIGWTGNDFYKHIVKENFLANTEVTIDDVHRVDHIFGPPKPLLQGEMIRLKPKANKIDNTNTIAHVYSL